MTNRRTTEVRRTRQAEAQQQASNDWTQVGHINPDIDLYYEPTLQKMYIKINGKSYRAFRMEPHLIGWVIRSIKDHGALYLYFVKNGHMPMLQSKSTEQ